MNTSVYLQAMGCVSALGADASAMRAPLFASHYPDTLTHTDTHSPGRTLALGCLPAATALADVSHVAPRLQSRNNALALTAVRPLRAQIEKAIAQFGPNRVAIVVGTSTSGINEGELAALHLHEEGQFPGRFDYAVQEMGNVAEFLAQELDILGPAYVISTACSSGAKALASAARLVRAGIVDAVVAGGVDALSPFTIAGFSALVFST